MEALLACRTPGHPCLPPDTQRIERVSVPQASLASLSLVHPLMVSPFLVPATTLHMMHAKANYVGITQRVAPFLDGLRAATSDPLQGIADSPVWTSLIPLWHNNRGPGRAFSPNPPICSPLAITSRCSSSSSCKRQTHHQPPQGRW